MSDATRLVSWRSLRRTVRAPFGILLIAGVGLVVPPQTEDMLDALSDGGVRGIGVRLMFHATLALLSISAWYWARALLAARFDVSDTRGARDELAARDKRVDKFAFNIVPRAMFVLAVLIGIGMIIRSGSWHDLLFLALWAIPLGLFVVFRMGAKDKRSRAHPNTQDDPSPGRPEETSRRVTPPEEPSRRSGLLRVLWGRILRLLSALWTRFLLLLRRAPFSDRWSLWPALVIFIIAIGGFIWGSLESFIKWGDEHASLPAIVGALFPGPAAALIALSLMIAPFSVLTFLIDGFRFGFTFKGRFLGFPRPPVMTVLFIWILGMPSLLSLHTVRIVGDPETGRQIGNRSDLDAFLQNWVDNCTRQGRPVRPVIVAVSGGASRAAVWGARVLHEVERVSGEGRPAIFAVSSVSGGSLGAAAYFSLLAGMSNEERCMGGVTPARQAHLAPLASPQLAQDALGPLLAGALFVDIPRTLFAPFAAFFRYVTDTQPRGGDRAEAIERAFERLWRQSGGSPAGADRIAFTNPFLSLFYDESGIRRGMPLWIANGTDMRTGSRLLTVPFDSKNAWPFAGAVDVLSALNADVPISTAINNTARFPYLEPSGELLRYPTVQAPAREPPPEDKAAHKSKPPPAGRAEIIDGGYFENEGLQTALDLAEWIEAKGLQPIIVQATADGSAEFTLASIVRCGSAPDDPTSIAPSPRSLQAFAPLVGLYSVRGGHSGVLLRRAKKDYCKTTSPSFFHFFLPGQEANADNNPDVQVKDKKNKAKGKDVPLNWILSQATHDFIWAAMDDKRSGNVEERDHLVKVFEAP